MPWSWFIGHVQKVYISRVVHFGAKVFMFVLQMAF